jgi:hypothetical protein
MCCCLQAGPGDYISKVAWLAGIPLDQLMIGNAETVKDLDAPLSGTRLLLCGAQQGKESYCSVDIQAACCCQQQRSLSANSSD